MTRRGGGRDGMRAGLPVGNDAMRPMTLHGILLSIVLALGTLGAMFAASYWLTALVFRRTGAPPALWAHVISGITGVLIMVGCVKLFLSVHLRRNHSGGPHGGGPFDFRARQVDNIIGAMNRIARGDFSVFIPVDKGDRFSELSDSVNRMARELGSMETMRQDFISNVSHEIQSPLTSIGGFAALLMQDEITDDQRKHYAAIVGTESKRLSNLSENLLKLSALDAQETALAAQVFRLDRQLENVALTMEPQWTAKRLWVEAALSKIRISGDEGLLSQVWVNLLNNAIKFTPEGGHIHIALTQEGDFAYVSISDTGIGIAPEDQPHIFERFYKADKSRDRALGGNGLGLSLVKKIVALHGGQVTVESVPGAGTSFHVSLPMKE